MKTVLMSWLGSLGVGAVTALVGGALGIWIANRAVTWYSISSREGNAGYFVVFQGLLAVVVGLILGVIISRVIVGGGGTQLKALGIACTTYVMLLAVVGGAARMLADVPPTVDGEELFVAVEVSWPESQAPAALVHEGVAVDSSPYLTLSSLRGGTLQSGDQGPLWFDDVRKEGGRVIVPGAVGLETSRGKRVLQVFNGTAMEEMSIELPIPAHPGPAESEWSVWMPRARPGAPALPDGVRYRFRVVKRSEPIRIMTIGPFSLAMTASAFSFPRYGDAPPVSSASATYAISYRGTPVVIESSRRQFWEPNPWKPDEQPPTDSVVRFDQVKDPYVVPGDVPALVATVEYSDGTYRYEHQYLIDASGGAVRTTYMGVAGRPLRISATAQPDASRPADGSTRPSDGYVNRMAMASPGLYLFPRVVMDTRTRSLQPLKSDRSDDIITQSEPLSLSPDEKHFAQFKRGNDGQLFIERVTIADNARQTIPVGSARTSTGDWADADQRFFDHYFAWTLDEHGGYRITARPGAISLPKQGRLREEPGYREYRVSPVDEALREEFIKELEKTFKAERVTEDSNGFSRTVRVDGAPVYLGYGDATLSMWMDRNTNTTPLVRITRHLDSVLATRRFDRHFLNDSTP